MLKLRIMSKESATMFTLSISKKVTVSFPYAEHFFLLISNSFDYHTDWNFHLIFFLTLEFYETRAHRFKYSRCHGRNAGPEWAPPHFSGSACHWAILSYSPERLISSTALWNRIRSSSVRRRYSFLTAGWSISPFGILQPDEVDFPKEYYLNRIIDRVLVTRISDEYLLQLACIRIRNKPSLF